MTRLFSLGGGHVVAVSRTASAPAAGWVPGDLSARAVVSQFVDLLYCRRQPRAAFDSCVVRIDFKDHTLASRRNRQWTVEELSRRVAKPSFAAQVEDMFFEGDRAVVHVRINNDGRVSRRMDMFRVDQGLIVEHWGYQEDDAA